MLQVAQDTARQAVALAATVCRSVAQNLPTLQTVTKSDLSPVTLADLASQVVIVATLRDCLSKDLGRLRIVAEEDAAPLTHPEHLTLGEATLRVVQRVRPDLTLKDVLRYLDPEQLEGHPQATQERFWTLDPVDGTKGFLRGQQYAIALALVELGQPKLGVLGCPNLSLSISDGVDTAHGDGSLYLALRGEGVEEWACSITAPGPIRRLPRRSAAHQPVLVCASVEAAHTRTSDVQAALGRLSEPTALLRLDSSAKYAVVARGQADAYLRLPTRPGYVERIWDHAAGAVVASEAGCTVTDTAGTPLDFGCGRGLQNNRGVVVATPDLQAQLVRILSSS